jgi:hypothetical protein
MAAGIALFSSLAVTSSSLCSTSLLFFKKNEEIHTERERNKIRRGHRVGVRRKGCRERILKAMSKKRRNRGRNASDDTEIGRIKREIEKGEVVSLEEKRT